MDDATLGQIIYPVGFWRVSVGLMFVCINLPHLPLFLCRVLCLGLLRSLGEGHKVGGLAFAGCISWPIPVQKASAKGRRWVWISPAFETSRCVQPLFHALWWSFSWSQVKGCIFMLVLMICIHSKIVCCSACRVQRRLELICFQHFAFREKSEISVTSLQTPVHGLTHNPHWVMAFFFQFVSTPCIGGQLDFSAFPFGFPEQGEVH